LFHAPADIVCRGLFLVSLSARDPHPHPDATIAVRTNIQQDPGAISR